MVRIKYFTKSGQTGRTFTGMNLDTNKQQQTFLLHLHQNRQGMLDVSLP